MKSAWRKDLVNLAAWNAKQVKLVDLDMVPFAELLCEEAIINSWAKNEGSFFDLDASVFN